MQAPIPKQQILNSTAVKTSKLAQSIPEEYLDLRG
jgi:hypothetical protein